MLELLRLILCEVELSFEPLNEYVVEKECETKIFVVNNSFTARAYYNFMHVSKRG